MRSYFEGKKLFLHFKEALLNQGHPINQMDCLLFVVSPSARGGARVARMAAKFDVDALPLFVGHCGIVAAGPLNFGVERVQVHCNTKSHYAHQLK